MTSVAPETSAASLLVDAVEIAHLMAGPCEPPPTDTYRLSMNTGPAAWGTCSNPERGRRYLRSPGGINFAPAGAAIGWTLHSPLSMLKLAVPHRLMRRAAQDLDLDYRSLDFRIAIQERDTQIEWLARSLHAEAIAGEPNGLLFRETVGLALSIVLLRKFGASAHNSRIENGRFAPAQLKRIVDYVESNLGREDLSLAQLAAVAGTSVSSFKILFKRSVGLPAHRFVIERRVERAAALLSLGRRISEVAAETGFAHATHLARWTRRLRGLSPSDLQRRSAAQ
ncbi:MAG TPA: AraC family transcriptional regulator [Steroidobacter sp.]|uniref:AraC family transcriptional regulator n=1 Tax=Steroidobacter sp. TaxID=1978227 RepID=UPI002ED80207